MKLIQLFCSLTNEPYVIGLFGAQCKLMCYMWLADYTDSLRTAVAIHSPTASPSHTH